MNDSDIFNYLLSHSTLDRFYLFTVPGNGGTMIKFFDSKGVAWNLMEDDDQFADRAVAFLRQSGARVFDDHAKLLEYEQVNHRNQSTNQRG